MKIIVNGRFLLHKVTGVERYAKEILMELDKIIEPHTIELAIPPEVRDIPVYKNIDVKKIGRLNNRLWEHFSFPMYVRKEKAISLNLCNVAPLVSPGVVCMHDAKIKAHPEFFSKKFVLWYRLLFYNQAKRSKAIITDSYFSKKELLKYYSIPEKKINVIYCGWQHYDRIKCDEHTLIKYKLKKGMYYFAMGSMDPNKNFKWIAEKAQNTPNEIFAVAGSINESVFAEGMGFECPSNMKLLGFVSDEEAKTLMRDCKVFLFPSIYEGFGIPPLEAICSGCKKIIVSDTEVMHEVLGNSVSYINQEDKNSSNNKEVLTKYSWENSAKELLKLLKDKGYYRGEK